MRDKLVRLIDDNKTCTFVDLECSECEYSDRTPCFAERMADVLIAHGVTFADVPDNNVGKWIPVSERLPDDSGNVILCTRSKIVGAGFYDKTTKNWVQHYSGGGICVEVTHWMPMPEPPKEGE